MPPILHPLTAKVYEFLLGIPLFSREHEMMDPEIYHLAQMIKFTEEFSPTLLKSYKLGSQFFDEDTGTYAS
jgi:hypothetical protein